MLSYFLEVCANAQEKINLDGESCSYHFAMNGKSYQVLVKHFYSLLPKVSSEETKRLLVLPVMCKGQ